LNTGPLGLDLFTGHDRDKKCRVEVASAELPGPHGDTTSLPSEAAAKLLHGGNGVFSYPQTEETKKLLSAEELAQELGVGRTTAYALLWSGQIPSMKVGRLRKVRREDVEAFIQAGMERSEHGAT
jgi:excisionase family DNA binding protein